MTNHRRTIRGGLIACLGLALTGALVPVAAAEPGTHGTGNDGTSDITTITVGEGQLQGTATDSGDPNGAASSGADTNGADANGTATPGIDTPGTVTLRAETAGLPLAMVAVTWPADQSADTLEIEYRTVSAGLASEWSELEWDGAEGESRTGTEPVIVGPVDAVEARLTRASGPVPDAELTVISAAARPADAAPQALAPTSGSDPAGADQVAGDAALLMGSAALLQPDNAPTVYSRAAWGAPENLVNWPTDYGRVLGAVVHHTATNQYAYGPDEVPGILRAIWEYQANQRGWGDIGYNFLIDRFGRIWEGRRGGVTQATIGAHALAYNSRTTGISLIGNFTSASPSQPAIESLTALLAWKLPLHQVRPGGSMVLDGRTYPAVVGHRDLAATACPGNVFYPMLGSIARAADARVRDAALPVNTGIPGTHYLYRFYHLGAGTHFYTSNPTEAAQVLTYKDYSYEGTVGIVSDLTSPVAAGQVPLNRFYKPAQGSHFYTASEYEANLVNGYSDYRREPATMSVYPQGGTANTVPVYRFLKPAQGTHFYTTSAAEAEKAKSYPDYRFEGVAFWVRSVG